MTAPASLLKTPFASAHNALLGRMVPFAGYSLPLHYADGLLAEHCWTREQAGLFDVSHMGPAFLRLAKRSGHGEADHRQIARLVEPLICADLQGLRPGELRYSLILNEEGGILDDIIIGRPPDPALQGSLYLVVNAGTKENDFSLLADRLGRAVRIERRDDWGLLALQGPQAADVIDSLCPGASQLSFMRFASFCPQGEPFWVSRSGYTGEDGFEILIPPGAALAVWDALLADARVRAVGLGARDSLRLEAGLPLYGHDLDASISPIEAGLAFAVSRRRRDTGDLPGQARLTREMRQGPKRLRVGLRVLEGAPAREGAVIARDGESVGIVTSGGFSPTLAAPIAMGFLPPNLVNPATRLDVIVRGRVQPAKLVPLPFVSHRYVRLA